MINKTTLTQRTLNLWAIVLIVWSIYRAKFQLPEWVDEFIAKPLVFIMPVYIYITQIDKADFFQNIYLKTKSFKKDIILSLVIGLIFFISIIFANLLKYRTFFPFTGQSFSFNSITYLFLLALATGISEEILSRGFILKRLYEDSKNIISSSFLASILFFFLHVPVLFTTSHITGNLLLFFMATNLILSLVNSFIFIERKSLALPILIHTFYNFFIALFV